MAVIFFLSCSQEEADNTSKKYYADSVAAAIAASAEEPATSNMIFNPDSIVQIDFSEAIKEEKIQYSLMGEGNSTSLQIKIKSTVNFSLEIEIKAGTYFKPQNANIQRMVVIKKTEINLKPKAEIELEIEVSCMDIEKDVPSKSSVDWSINFSEDLKQLIKCIDSGIDEAKAMDKNIASMLEQSRQLIKQLAIWRKEGATNEEFVEFYIKYQELDEEEARSLVNSLIPIVDELLKECP